MARFKANPKQKSSYPGMLENFEKNRKREWIIAKAGFNQNRGFKAADSRRLQMFSGKRGK